MENLPIINIIENNVAPTQKVLYTGITHVTGGRDGFALSNDRRLNTKLSSPGSTQDGTNPEQLFAAGWSACFIGAMQHNAADLGLLVPESVAVNAAIDLTTGANGFQLQARLHVILPGLTQEGARALVASAHKSCPYSKATSGNINVLINVSV